MPQVVIQNTATCSKMETQGISDKDVGVLRERVAGGESAVGFTMFISHASGQRQLVRNSSLSHDELERVSRVIADFVRELGHQASTVVAPNYCRISWSDRPLAA